MRKNKKNNHELLEKVERLIEEPPQEAEPPQEVEPPKPEKKKPTAVRERALITYIALLFTVAFVLVLLSFLAQQRDISQLNENASSALSRAEKLQDENRELIEDNQTLRQQLQEALDRQEELSQAAQKAGSERAQAQEAQASLQGELDGVKAAKENQLKAYELLLQAQRALDEERTEDFQKNMTELAALADSLDTLGKALYQELLAATAVSPEE